MDPSYNDSFGSFAQPTAVVSDGKSKKRWVIVAIVFVVLALVSIIAVALIGSGKIKTGFTPEEKYLNYLKNGDEYDGDNVNTEYDPIFDYAFIDALYLDTYDVSYFSHAKSLLGGLSINETSEEYYFQKEMLNMFLSYKTIDTLGADGIIGIYLNEGIDSLNEKVVDGINDINNTFNTYTNIYGLNAQGYINNLVQMADLYKENGCAVVDSTMNCSASIDIEKLASEGNNYWYLVQNMIDDAAQVFLGSAYNLGGNNV